MSAPQCDESIWTTWGPDHRCKNRARWEVKRIGDDHRFVCGVHVKHYQRLPLDFAVIPLAAAAASVARNAIAKETAE